MYMKRKNKKGPRLIHRPSPNHPAVLSLHPPRPLGHNSDQKPNGIRHHVRAEGMSNPVIHPILQRKPAIPVPAARPDRVLEQRHQRRGPRIRNELVVAARADQDLLAPDSGIEYVPETVLFGHREGNAREGLGRGAEEDGSGIVGPESGEQIAGEVVASKEGGWRVEDGVLVAFGHESWTEWWSVWAIG
ncbi:hypothetical protein E4U53_002823 [Claviceps sorghi]|nr:hypothetical protein E4U53_002823 [Claviceps sorghi]